MFAAPASQLQNEFLRDERGYTAAGISMFTILTSTPAGIAVLAGGHLAEVRGRRLVGAVGLAGGSVLLAAVYLTSGWPMWVLSLLGSDPRRAHGPRAAGLRTRAVPDVAARRAAEG